MGIAEIIVLMAIVVVIIKKRDTARGRIPARASRGMDEAVVQKIMNAFKKMEDEYELGRVAFLLEYNDTARLFIREYGMMKHSTARIDDPRIIFDARTLLEGGMGILVFPDNEYKNYHLYCAKWKTAVRP